MFCITVLFLFIRENCKTPTELQIIVKSLKCACDFFFLKYSVKEPQPRRGPLEGINFTSMQKNSSILHTNSSLIISYTLSLLFSIIYVIFHFLYSCIISFDRECYICLIILISNGSYQDDDDFRL